MTKRRIFLGYCAFAPFVHAILGMLFASAINHPDPLSFASFQVFLALPFSAWFLAETSWFYANGVTSTLASCSHTSAYCYLYVSKTLAEVNGRPTPLPQEEVFLFALMGCLMLTSIALLMTWDIMKRKEQAPVGISS